MMCRLLNDEQAAYLAEIVVGHKVREIATMLNEKFGINITPKQVMAQKKYYGLHSGRMSPPNKLTTKEQDKWIKDNSYGKSSREIQAMIKEKFGLELSLSQIKSYKTRHGINTGLTGWFKPGAIPPNKGRKLSAEHYAKAKATMFKKGMKPHNWVPVGSERVNTEGFVDIKIAEHRWKQKARIVWEEHNGPIPDGYLITYADGNKLNCDISNLRCISKAENIVLNNIKLRSNNPEITDVGISIAKVMKKTKELRSKKNGEK